MEPKNVFYIYFLIFIFKNYADSNTFNLHPLEILFFQLSWMLCRIDNFNGSYAVIISHRKSALKITLNLKKIIFNHLKLLVRRILNDAIVYKMFHKTIIFVHMH